MSRTTRVCWLAVLVVFSGSLDVASGQSNPLQERLATAKRLECRFQLRATGSWEAGGASAVVVPSELRASFSDIDIEQGTAQADGRVGSSFIVVRFFPDYLHLLHMIDIGPVYVTTVLAQETVDGRLKAIHTRHKYARSSYPEFREWPDMYVGDCAVGD